LEREFGREFLVRNAAHAIGAEMFSTHVAESLFEQRQCNSS
jgi:hypothetical protein